MHTYMLIRFGGEGEADDVDETWDRWRRTSFRGGSGPQAHGGLGVSTWKVEAC